FFFFQAEDGIRDFHVTGVQTCALPILLSPLHAASASRNRPSSMPRPSATVTAALSNCAFAANNTLLTSLRSSAVPSPPVRNTVEAEERRVGKECTSR